jgi:hypothetical protein
MRMNVIPSKNIKAAMLSFKSEPSFFFEYDDSGKILILYLKLLSYMATSVMNGASMRLVVRNPVIEEYSMTFYIDDNIDAPLYITKVFLPSLTSRKSQAYPKLAEAASYFETNRKFRIAIFDELSRNIFAIDTPVFLPVLSLKDWYTTVTSSTMIPAFDDSDPQENDMTGYMVKIGPIVFSESSHYKNVMTTQLWGDEPYLVSINKADDFFTMSKYLGVGALGYLQEQNIREKLGFFFKPNADLFSSARLSNGHELIDIIFGDADSLVLLESKTVAAYNGSLRNVGSKSRSIIKSINKGVSQLLLAETTILESPYNIANNRLREKCVNAKRVAKFCIVSDTLLIEPEPILQSLKNFAKHDLPIIMSLATFYEILDEARGPMGLLDKLFEIDAFKRKTD